jgi:gas vesicle protein
MCYKWYNQTKYVGWRVPVERDGGVMAHGRKRAFLLGGLLGAGVALLFAPRSGSETRALLTDKAEELWGEGQDLYSQGYEKVKAEAANVQSTAAKANDELRAKIENARTVIAEQVAKNAQSARDAINAQVPVAGDKIHQAVDVVKGQIDNAASKLKSTAANLASKDADAADKVAAAAGAAPAAAVDAAKSVAEKPAEAVADAAKGVAEKAEQAAEKLAEK